MGKMEADIEMSEEQVANNSSDSDSDESDKSEEDEDMNDVENEEIEKKIAALQETVSSNVYSYNPHVELIKLLRKNGDLDALNGARERMSSVFPLTEELWLEWLQDEMKFAESSDRPKIINLLERAVKDYTTVGLWLEYVQYSIGGMAEERGLETVRGVFERALTAVGINVASGSMLWEAYREFESAVLAGLQPAPGAVSTSDEMKQIEQQTARIVRLFQRQLSVPLLDMEKTLEEYRDWIDGKIDSETQKKYDAAFNKLKQILPFEKNMVNSDPPHLAAYIAYLDHETQEGDPVRVLSLYERAITDNCLDTDLWTRYIRYIESTLKSSDSLVPVYERALRNCPWSVDLWVGFLCTLEQFGQDHQRVLDVFNRALGSGFTQGSEYLRLWTAYLDYLRRRIHWNEDHDKELEALRAAFEQAISHMNQSYPVDGDPTCSLTQYWAFIEAKYCRNMSKARELWSSLLQLCFANQAAMCLEYVRLERCHGDVKHCRKLLQRVVNSVTDWPESVCQEYIKFEREEGDLESYRDAVHKCEVQLKKVEVRRAKEAEKELEAARLKKQQKADKKRQTKNKQTTPPNNNKQQQQQQQQSATTRSQQSDQSVRPYSRSRPPPGAPVPPPGATGATTPSSSTDEAVVYVRGQKRKLEPETQTVSVPAADNKPVDKVPAAGFKVPPPPGYKPKPPSSAESAPKKSKIDMSDDHDSQSGRSVWPVGGASKENCTVFVSNLDFSITSQQIEDMFNKLGELSEVRLVTNFKGRSKGYAYVEFKDEFPVAEALKLDRQAMNGRPMFVSPCNPSSGGQKFRFNTGLERNKLFIKGLPHSITQQQLEDLFAPHGALKEVRLVTYRSGAPKGLAYVDFETESSAAQAVLKLDGHVIDEHTISVAISNPPARSQPMETAQSTFVPSLGGGKKQTTDHGKARTQLALLPRSVHRPSTTSTVPSTTSTPGMETSSGDTATGAAAAGGHGMSNSDFRSMLLR